MLRSRLSNTNAKDPNSLFFHDWGKRLVYPAPPITLQMISWFTDHGWIDGWKKDSVINYLSAESHRKVYAFETTWNISP